MIDGVIYDLNTPTTIHQQLAFEIRIRLREYIRQNKGLCMVLPSPVSVQLDEDDRTSLYAVTEIKSFEVMSTEHRIW